MCVYVCVCVCVCVGVGDREEDEDRRCMIQGVESHRRESVVINLKSGEERYP